MPRCRGTKRDGSQCVVSVDPPPSYCWYHDTNSRRAASKGGKGRPSREIRSLKKQLEELAENVLKGDVDRGDAAVVTQVVNARARLIELERRIREQEEILDRIEARFSSKDKELWSTLL